MLLVISFLIALLFGLGLCLSGMTEPTKVLGFLDLGGAWDPSLALVMGGAVGVGVIGFHFASARLGKVTRAHSIDTPLVVGSLIFGIGWGLTGFCPGPAVVDVGFLSPRALVFVLSMAAGMGIYYMLAPRFARRDPSVEDS